MNHLLSFLKAIFLTTAKCFPRYSRGYFPKKTNLEYLTSFRLKLGIFSLEIVVFPRYSRFLRSRMVKTVNREYHLQLQNHLKVFEAYLKNN